MKPIFNLQLIARLDEIWDEKFHQKWQPIYRNDLKLNQSYDFIKTIVNRVKLYNESYDMTIVETEDLGSLPSGLVLPN
ncbi:MAG TPA: hypothetical protein HA306_02555 [Methanosarcina sp.]|nr:hypothetical protein [Methanosarcina sp.]